MRRASASLAYRPELDGLWGLAILMVLVFHSFLPVLQGGFIGVDIFFVLSGFLITYLLIREHDRFGSISLRKFYMRRILRLMPALLLMLLVFCLLSYLLLDPTQARRNAIDALISLVYLANWARALDIHPPDFLGHTWSLAIEEQFYILWPALLVLLLRQGCSRRQLIQLTVLLLLLSWLLRLWLLSRGASVERLYNGLDTRADALLIGCVLGLVLGSGYLPGARLSGLLRLSAPLALLLLVWMATWVDWMAAYMYAYGFVLVALLSLVLILDVMVNERSLLRGLLASRLLVWVGSISYGLYLWHFPVFRSLFAMGFDRWAVLALGALISFLIAGLSYYWLEKPALRFKQRFRRGVSAPAVPTGLPRGSAAQGQPE